jgi:hypothetical protein
MYSVERLEYNIIDEKDSIIMDGRIGLKRAECSIPNLCEIRDPFHSPFAVGCCYARYVFEG